MPIIRSRRSSVFPFRVAASGQTWAVPSAVTDFANSSSNRISAALNGYTRARLTMRTNGAGDAGSIFKVQYSTDESTWSDLGCSIVADATGLQIGSWATIPSAARSSVNLRLVGLNGAASASGSYANILLEAK